MQIKLLLVILLSSLILVSCADNNSSNLANLTETEKVERELNSFIENICSDNPDLNYIKHAIALHIVDQNQNFSYGYRYVVGDEEKMLSEIEENLCALLQTDNIEKIKWGSHLPVLIENDMNQDLYRKITVVVFPDVKIYFNDANCNLVSPYSTQAQIGLGKSNDNWEVSSLSINDFDAFYSCF